MINSFSLAVIVNISAMGIRALITLATTLLLSKSLGISDFGTAAIIITTIQLVTNIAELGLRTTFVAAASKPLIVEPELRNSVMRYGLHKRLISLCILTFILSGILIVGKILGYFNELIYQYYFTCILLGLFITMTNFLLTIKRVEGKFTSYAIFQVVAPALRLTLLCGFFLYLYVSLDILIITYFTSVLILLIILCYTEPMWLRALKSKKSLHPTIEYINFIKAYNQIGIWMVVCYCIESVAVKLDIYMISALLDSTSVGVYFAAYQFLSLILMIGGSVGVVLLPKIASQNIGDFNISYVFNIFRKSFVFAFFVAISFALVTPPLFDVFYSRDFGEVDSVLYILIASGFFALSQVGSGQIIIKFLPKYYLLILALVNLLTNWGMNYIMIPAMGIEGAAIATMLSYCTVSVLSWTFCFAIAISESKKRNKQFFL